MTCKACCTDNLALPDDFNPLQTFQAGDKFQFVLGCPQGVSVVDCRQFINPGFAGIVPDEPFAPATQEICNSQASATTVINGILCGQYTVAAGTICLTVALTAPPDFAARAQTAVTAQALRYAQQQSDAQAAVNCTFCNAVQTQTVSCPGNPSISATGTVPAKSFCAATQAAADGLASTFAWNLAQSILSAKGCDCAPVFVSGYNVTNASKCSIVVSAYCWNGGFVECFAPFTANTILAGGTLNWDNQWWEDVGNHLLPGTYAFGIGGNSILYTV